MDVVLQKEEEFNRNSPHALLLNANRLPKHLSLGSRGCAKERVKGHFNKTIRKQWQDIQVPRPKSPANSAKQSTARIKFWQRRTIRRDNMVPTAEERLPEYGTQLKREAES